LLLKLFLALSDVIVGLKEHSLELLFPKVDRLKLVGGMLNARKVAFLVVESYFYEYHEPLDFDLVLLESYFSHVKVWNVRSYSDRNRLKFV
jgi:hypothetical protein